MTSKICSIRPFALIIVQNNNDREVVSHLLDAPDIESIDCNEYDSIVDSMKHRLLKDYDSGIDIVSDDYVRFFESYSLELFRA